MINIIRFLPRFLIEGGNILVAIREIHFVQSFLMIVSRERVVDSIVSFTRFRILGSKDSIVSKGADFTVSASTLRDPMHYESPLRWKNEKN